MAKKILIADDAGFIREILRSICESAGYIVVAEAKDGDEVIELCRHHNPDIVLMDLVMPMKNGIQATEIILEENPDIRVIACSTLEASENQEKAKAIGVSGFIQKPFKKEEVLEEIRRVRWEGEVR